jgi:hypothetical protein
VRHFPFTTQHVVGEANPDKFSYIFSRVRVLSGFVDLGSDLKELFVSKGSGFGKH